MSAHTAVRERPILFSSEMVRAILAGRKTQARRVVKPQPPEDYGSIYTGGFHPTIIVDGIEEPGDEVFGAWTDDGEWGAKSPFGGPADRLWVRETFYIDLVPYDRGPLPKEWPADLPIWRCSRCGFETGDSEKIRNIVDGVNYLTCPRCMGVGEFVDAITPLYYRADGECCEQIPECCCGEVGPVPWRPSIHMPRWASRLTLEITNVRVERVQDISGEDILAEGVVCPTCANSGWKRVGDTIGDNCECTRDDGGSLYRALWDSLNAKRGYGWNVNPWVWVIEFRVLSPSASARRERDT